MITASFPSKKRLLAILLIPLNLLLFLTIVYNLEKHEIISTNVTSSLEDLTTSWGNFDLSYLTKQDYLGSNSTLDTLGYQISKTGVKFKFTNPLRKKGEKADIVKQNSAFYDEFMKKKISEPKDYNLELIRPPPKDKVNEYQRANATIVSLVRNHEFQGVIKSMILFEKKFNYKFNYPYTFINDEEFDEKFKKNVKQYTKAQCNFVTVPKELWEKPSFIDEKKETKKQDIMYKKNVAYAKKPSYHNMCRFYSGNFYNVPELQKYRYYWRIEPSVKFYSELNYDVFKYLEKTEKVYGFTTNLYDIPESIETLWPQTLKYLNQEDNYKYVNPNGAFNWILEPQQNPRNYETTKFSTCHFWSNFEIGDMDFFRGEAYSNWFNYLDSTGGFYYERWGDAPVHSMGLALFADKKKIHWFRDIGYFHDPYLNCPNNDNTRVCKTGQFTRWGHLKDQNCMTNWIQLAMDENDREIY